jgi:mycofactocin glycosyltransferase
VTSTNPPTSPTLPTGFCITLDPGSKQLDGTTWFGGSPARVLRLSAAGAAALADLRSGPVRNRATGTVARRLTDAGLAHPRPPALITRPDVTVIIPVRDRPVMLDYCLTALGGSYPVLVVDDRSADPGAVAEVAAAHGAVLLARPSNGGPGAARNTGLARASSDLVAFLDSDCVPEMGWIEQLAAHLADPAVAAAAPRIVPLPAGQSWASRYTGACSSLDLGDQPARVAPGSRVGYVPTAALVVRRAALLAVGGPGGVFDPGLRWGEDVDLVWRLHEAGWRIRYEPAVWVGHHEPVSWPGLLARRFRYGTSAAPLALRHPAAMPPLVLHPWPTLTVAGLLGGNPAAAAASFTASVLTMRATLRRAGLPARGVVSAMLTATRQTWLGMGRYGTQFGPPLLAAALAGTGPGGPARRWRRRAAVASLLFGPPLTTWLARRPALDPARFVLSQVADDLAYGAGVWAGVLRTRTLVPVRPVIAWHPLRGLHRPGGAASRTPPIGARVPPPSADTPAPRGGEH